MLYAKKSIKISIQILFAEYFEWRRRKIRYYIAAIFAQSTPCIRFRAKSSNLQWSSVCKMQHGCKITVYLHIRAIHMSVILVS